MPLLPDVSAGFYCEVMVSRYRSVLYVKGVRRLLVTSVLARMPLGICSLAILLFVREQTGSFLAAGLAVAAFTLTGAAVAPVQGALLDRFGQLRVLVPCAGGQGALLIALVVLGDGAPSVAIITLAGLAGALTPPISACVRVLWPQVALDAAAREAAYALDAITQEIIWTCGPLLVAVVVELASPAGAVLMGAAITVLGTGLFASSSLVASWRAEPTEGRSRKGALESPGLRVLLASVTLTGMTIGAIEVGLPALAAHLGSRGSSGVLLALWSVGSMLGGLLYGTHAWRASMGTRYEALLASVVLLTASLLLAHSLAGGMALSVLAGLAVAPMFSCQYTLVNALAPRGTMAQAFTWQTAALVAGIAAGSALSGTLVDSTGVFWCFVLGCAGAALACALTVVERQRIDPAI